MLKRILALSVLVVPVAAVACVTETEDPAEPPPSEVVEQEPFDRETDKAGFCSTAKNGSCDEPVKGTGTCPEGTDHWDCGYCPWKDDGWCDEPEKWNFCPDGSDGADCPSAPPAGSGWVCWATGSYQVCPSDGGYCQTYSVQKMGWGATEGEASTSAYGACSSSMTSMIITNNIAGSASQSSPCQVVSCNPA